MLYNIKSEREFNIAMDYLRNKTLSNTSQLSEWTPTGVSIKIDKSFYSISKAIPNKLGFEDLAKVINIPDLNLLTGLEAAGEISKGHEVEVLVKGKWRLFDESFSVKWLFNPRYIFRPKARSFTKTITLPVTSVRGKHTACFKIEGFNSKIDADTATKLIHQLFNEN